MKLLTILYSGLFLFLSLSIQAANDCRPDTVFYSQVSVASDDSLRSEKKIAKNTAANTAKTMGIISGLWNILGLISAIGLKNTHSTLGNLQIGRIAIFGSVTFFGGILGLLTLIAGIVGAVQRRRLIEKIYRYSPQSYYLPLGQWKSALAIIMGLIGVGVFAAVIVGG